MAVLKALTGYNSGHTIRRIMAELELVDEQGRISVSTSSTTRGATALEASGSIMGTTMREGTVVETMTDSAGRTAPPDLAPP
jgi:hypothetical protein